MTAVDEPLVIVGSRLQALIFAVAAIGIPIGLWERFGPWTLLVAVPSAVAAGATLHRRVELHPDAAVVRHRFLPSTTVPMSDIDASAGHRYLRLNGRSRRIRIEVPVEIRPDVRAWTKRAGPDQRGQTGSA